MLKKFKIFLICLFSILPMLTFNSTYSANLRENSYIVIDVNSNGILVEKNADEKVYPASTTKLLTCTLALENLNLDDTITVTKEMLAEVPKGSSTMKLVAGDTLTVSDLLHGLMLPSGNDAAIVVAHLVSGSTDAFIELMNQRLVQIGCKSSHFTCPHGFHDDNHYTTARDMSKIFLHALENEKFLEIISKGTYTLKANNIVTYDRKYTSTNQLINNPKYPIYGKTGYTDEAGNVFVSYIDYNDYKLITILLDGDKNYFNNKYRFDDTLSIHEYIFNNYSKQNVIPSQKIKMQVIDKNSNIDYSYSNPTDFTMLADSTASRLTYNIKNSITNFNNIYIKINSNNYYLNDGKIELNETNSTELKTTILSAETIKIIIFILVDVIMLLLFFISIYMIYLLNKPKKKKKIKKKYY